MLFGNVKINLGKRNLVSIYNLIKIVYTTNNYNWQNFVKKSRFSDELNCWFFFAVDVLDT